MAGNIKRECEREDDAHLVLGHQNIQSLIIDYKHFYLFWVSNSKNAEMFAFVRP